MKFYVALWVLDISPTGTVIESPIAALEKTDLGIEIYTKTTKQYLSDLLTSEGWEPTK